MQSAVACHRSRRMSSWRWPHASYRKGVQIEQEYTPYTGNQQARTIASLFLVAFPTPGRTHISSSDTSDDVCCHHRTLCYRSQHVYTQERSFSASDGLDNKYCTMNYYQQTKHHYGPGQMEGVQQALKKKELSLVNRKASM